MQGYTHFFPIAYSATDVTVYQQDVVIHRATGTAYQETVGTTKVWHIYVGTKCKADYGDIRFTKSDGTTELNYYLWPDYTSSQARFTVKLEGTTNAGQIMVWYGNSGAVTTSNGDATFPLFDDFTGSSIDTTKWITHIGTDGSPSITVANGEAIFTSGSTGSGARYVAIESKQLFGSGYQMVGKLRSSATGNRPQRYTIIGFGATYYSYNVNQLGDLVAAPGGAYWRDAESNSAYWGTVPSGGQGSGTWTRSEKLVSTSYQIFSSSMRSDGIDWDIDGTTYSYDSNPITGEIPVVVGIDAHRTTSGDQTTDIVDWVLVRAYSATPPAATAFGPEQAPGSLHHVQGVVFGSANMMVI